MALSDPPANKAPDDKNINSHGHYLRYVMPWIKGALVVGWIGILIYAASSQDPGGHEVSMALSDPPANKAPDDKNTSHKHYFNHVRPWIKGALVVGWIGILICAASSQDPSGGWLSFLRRLGFGTLIGGGAAVGGFVVGFLFGIPKTPDHATSSVNTNLEQVSDWLTKIIVGISLVEFNRIIGKVSQLATFLGNGMGWSSGGPEYATAVIIYYLPLGFFFGWVITRTFISKWLASRGGEK